MARRVTLAVFADALDEMASAIPFVPLAAAKVIAPVLVENVRGIMGTSALQDLAPDTQSERVRLGFTPNDPLVRTGDLRASVRPIAMKVSAGALSLAVSDDPIAGYQEKGTPWIPPRPAFRMGLLDTRILAQRIIKGIVGRVLGKLT
jgi:hypothetical protein